LKQNAATRDPFTWADTGSVRTAQHSIHSYLVFQSILQDLSWHMSKSLKGRSSTWVKKFLFTVTAELSCRMLRE